MYNFKPTNSLVDGLMFSQVHKEAVVTDFVSLVQYFLHTGPGGMTTHIQGWSRTAHQEFNSNTPACHTKLLSLMFRQEPYDYTVCNTVFSVSWLQIGNKVFKDYLMIIINANTLFGFFSDKLMSQ